MSAQTFIGRMISLTSHSDIRYTGILEGIDQQNSTITLKNVFSLGTEHRQPLGTPNHIPPNLTPYNQVVFKAQNVKDISVDDAQPPASLPNDPAVLSAAQAPPAGGQFGSQPTGYNNAPAQPPSGYNQSPQQPQQPRQPQQQPRAPRPPKQQNNGVDQVSRSMNNMHLDNGNGAGGSRPPPTQRRNNHPHHNQDPKPVTIPDTDFDFAQSNARFNKVAPPPLPVDNNGAGGAGGEDETKTNPSDSEGEQQSTTTSASKKAEKANAYNPTKSFFDQLSTSAPPATGPRGGAPGGGGGGGGGGRRGGGRGGGRGRTRREEEREKNVATFGEAGGVGILGPGAYVGGWGSGGGNMGGRRRGGASPNPLPGGPSRR